MKLYSLMINGEYYIWKEGKLKDKVRLLTGEEIRPIVRKLLNEKSRNEIGDVFTVRRVR